jgi:hypothetical protein
MSLKDCAPDALDRITSTLTAYELATLWFCGDSHLNLKLSTARGVTRFDFEYDPARKPLWPNLLAQLEGITDISIQFDKLFGIVVPNMLQISPTVRNMVLNFPYALAFFQSALRIDPVRFQNLEVLEYLPRAYDNPRVKLVGLNLPNLKRLSLPLGGRSRQPFDMKHLPSSLTALSFDSRKPENFDVEHLKNLSFLDVTLSEKGDVNDFWHLLPDTLIHLSTRFSSGDTSVYSWNWSALPRQLRSLSVSCPDFDESVSVQLPPALEVLEISSSFEAHSISLLKSLPPQLKCLVMIVFEASISPEIAKVLPRSLKGCLFSAVDSDAVHLLPAGITEIQVISSSEEKHHQQIMMIEPNENPLNVWSTLVHLTVTVLHPHIAKLLPANLKTLEIDGGSLNHDLMSLLPKNLIIFGTSQGALRPRIGKLLVDSVHWGLLPRHLTSLSIAVESLELSYESSSLLPRNLQTLELECLSIDSSEWFVNLPPTLTSFTLKAQELPPQTDETISVALPHLGYLSIAVTSVSGCKVEQLIQNLPRRLVTFSFDIKDEKGSCQVSEKDISRLPPSLTQLHLPDSPNLQSFNWETCPPYLVSLGLGYRFSNPFWNSLQERRSLARNQFRQYLQDNAQDFVDLIDY